jgi:hypothetical protein
MLDNECLVRYLLSIEQNKCFDINNIKFKNYDCSFEELFKFTKYYPDIEKYIDYIKSNICVLCNQKQIGNMKIKCRCYVCKKCFELYKTMMSIKCPLCPQSKFIECSII